MSQKAGPASGSIYEFVAAHVPGSGPGLLAGGHDLPDEADRHERIRFAPGARDGAFGHHFGVGGDDEPADRIFDLVLRASTGRRPRRRFRELYDALRTVEALSVVDPLLERVLSSSLPPTRVYELARGLAFESAHRGPVKVGLALLGLFNPQELADQLTTLGRHEEFTLYVAVALGTGHAEGEAALWRLAQQVHGWGRIHLVERLADTDRAEIKDWILRDGFRNSITDEYLAYAAATTADLARALAGDRVDDELLAAAGDILSALIAGGPAEDIDDYLDGAHTTRLYLDHMATRAQTLEDLLHVGDIAGFLDQDADWDARELRGWTAQLRAGLRVDCAAIIEQARWRDLVAADLYSADDGAFYRADRAARLLGIPTLPAHLARLRRDPSDDACWYHIMELSDADNIDELLHLAGHLLPIQQLATGPSDDLGLGPSYRVDRCLGYVVQGLCPWPSRGWRFIETALTNRVIHNRSTATRALAAWPRETWPDDAEQALASAADREPNDRLRAHMNKVLTSKASH